jgi:hypothetical protein
VRRSRHLVSQRLSDAEENATIAERPQPTISRRAAAISVPEGKVGQEHFQPVMAAAPHDTANVSGAPA